MKKVILKCQNLLSCSQTTVLELTKLIGLMFINCPSRSVSSSTAKVFTTTTNKITKPSLFIPGRDSIKQSVKTGSSLVGGKFMIKQWKITKAKGYKQRHQNQVGEPFATGCQLGGNGQKRRRTYIQMFWN